MRASATDKKPEHIKIKGRVVSVRIEGGFMGIVADNGQKYYPVNPLKGFKDGQRVEVEIFPCRFVMTCQMWGYPVRVISIKALVEKK